MGMDSYITGKNNNCRAEIFNPEDEDREGKCGLNVFTNDRIKKTYRPALCLNPNFGLNQAINGAFSGTPDQVHNGIDTTLWTGSNISGVKVTFNSTAQANSGSASVLIDGPQVGNIWEFDKGSSVTASSYTALSGAIYIDSNWGPGDEVSVYAYDTGTASTVGNEVLLTTYINEFDFGVWRNFAIPFADMGLTSGTFDAIRMEQTSKTGPSATWYLDDFQIEETSGATEFIFAPNEDEIYHMDSFAHHVVVTASEAVTKDPSKYYGITALTNGVLITVRTEGFDVFGLGIPDLATMSIGPHSRPVEFISSGTQTIAKLTTDHPTILDGSKGDFFKYTVSDDLTGLDSQTVFLFGWYEGVHS